MEQIEEYPSEDDYFSSDWCEIGSEPHSSSSSDEEDIVKNRKDLPALITKWNKVIWKFKCYSS